MNRTLKAAIIGAGKMGAEHAAALSTLSGAKLVAVADPYISHETMARTFGRGVYCFSKAEEMLRQIRPDVVHVVTPPHTHVELAGIALKHGASVYVEKPFAGSTNEAKGLIEEAQKRDLKFCAAHQVLYQDTGRQLTENLAQIGEPIHVESYFSFRQVRKSGRGRLSPVEQTIDILPHPVYLLLAVLCADQPDDVPIELTSLDVDAEGEVRANVLVGERRGSLVVTLQGRPIESYLRVVGRNGSLFADFVLSGLTKLTGPGTSGPAVASRPFQQSLQVAIHTTVNLTKMIFRPSKSYPGLAQLLEAFYESISSGGESPTSESEVLRTVQVCEWINEALLDRQRSAELDACRELERASSELRSVRDDIGPVLVTGGTGFVGRKVVRLLRSRGIGIRVVTRKKPSVLEMLPGVEYIVADLSRDPIEEGLAGIDIVIHLAAETSGQDHQENTIVASKRLLETMVRIGVRKLIQISSVAVLKPSGGAPLNEASEVDVGNTTRGPYVAAKASQELITAEIAGQHGIEVRTVRLGPVVDYQAFDAPGRLGRDIGVFFVAVGSPSSEISVCDVGTAAEVISYLVNEFDTCEQTINLLESPPPSRGELIERLRENRPDLRVFWLPMTVVKILTSILYVVSKFSFGKVPFVDLSAAFGSQPYDTNVAMATIAKARTVDRVEDTS